MQPETEMLTLLQGNSFWKIQGGTNAWKATSQLYLHTALQGMLRARWELDRGTSPKETSSESLLLLKT